jgi:hypothetical protein
MTTNGVIPAGWRTWPNTWSKKAFRQKACRFFKKGRSDNPPLFYTFAAKGAGLSDYYQGLVNAGLFAGAGQEFDKWLWKYAQNPACQNRGLASWPYVLGGKTVACLGRCP